MQCQLFSFITIVVAVFVQTASAKPVPVTQGNVGTPMKESPLDSSAECANGPRFAVQSPSPLLSWTRCDGNESPSVQRRQLIPIPYLSNELWHGGSGWAAGLFEVIWEGYDSILTLQQWRTVRWKWEGYAGVEYSRRPWERWSQSLDAAKYCVSSIWELAGMPQWASTEKPVLDVVWEFRPLHWVAG